MKIWDSAVEDTKQKQILSKMLDKLSPLIPVQYDWGCRFEYYDIIVYIYQKGKWNWLIKNKIATIYNNDVNKHELKIFANPNDIKELISIFENHGYSVTIFF